ncbi:MAG: lysine exporter protein LysE/YggA [Promethearchaeota archaeon CR_4]|nr:MAG: lysine exporter protein LysE/YggA [Candidatus Lokiarchaeota archaeon CR_4]
MTVDFWTLLLISLLAALTGALSPGPLFKFTVEKSLACGRRGWSVGFWAILGHALIEGVILAALLLGLSAFLDSSLTLLIIGIVGGLVLFVFGLLYLKDAISGKLSLRFPDTKSSCEDTPEIPTPAGENSPNAVERNFYPLWKVVLGGILVSMSNPYWWIWWVTVGLDLVLLYLPFLGTGLGVTAFFVGHELGDLSWYLLVSVLVFAGRKTINVKVYRGFILACGIFILVLGVYSITSAILSWM